VGGRGLTHTQIFLYLSVSTYCQYTPSSLAGVFAARAGPVWRIARTLSQPLLLLQRSSRGYVAVHPPPNLSTVPPHLQQECLLLAARAGPVWPSARILFHPYPSPLPTAAQQWLVYKRTQYSDLLLPLNSPLCLAEVLLGVRGPSLA